MKLESFCVLLTITGLTSLSGCSIFSSAQSAQAESEPTPPPPPAKPGATAAGAYANGSRAPESGARQDFASMSADDAARRAEGAPAQRQTSLVGLYGELVGTDEESGGPFDGSSNVSQVSFSSEGACFDPDVDRTGRWMTFASTMHRMTSDIYLKSISGKTVTQLTNDPSDDSMPTFSPDGKRVAFCSNRAGNWDVYVMSVEGGQPVQVSSEPEHELHPSWSPDGRLLAYCKLGAQSDRWEMWVVEVANPGVRHFLDYGLFPEWNPDPGRSKILFQRARQRGSRFHSVWTVDYVNGEAMHPTEVVSAANAATINPSWSPDGSKVAFATVVEPETHVDAPPPQADIWIVNLDGSGRTNLTNGKFANFQPVWCTDARVYFVSNRSTVDNIWSVATDRAVAAMRNPTPEIQAAHAEPMRESIHMEPARAAAGTAHPTETASREAIAHAEAAADDQLPSPEH